NVSLIIKELEIYDDFDSIICGDEVDNGKPNPEMFNKTIDRFKINKNECLIFEDSLEGIKAAKNSGINVIGITSSSSHKTLKDAGSTMNVSNYVDFDLAKI
ncbi:MAG: HAD-IA family hydrolase, partial [Cryomorphaceae bacterium]|nr:HAD-IA family hydrolase [Cryomorphaceae bacterium]